MVYCKNKYYDMLSIKNQTMRTSVKDSDIRYEYWKARGNVDKAVENIKRDYK